SRRRPRPPWAASARRSHGWAYTPSCIAAPYKRRGLPCHPAPRPVRGARIAAMPASLWQRETAPLGAPSPPPQSCDVAIIGGGIAGISTALHLAQQGAEVVVLEAEQVAARASGRNDGQLLLGLGEHYHRI